MTSREYSLKKETELESPMWKTRAIIGLRMASPSVSVAVPSYFDRKRGTSNFLKHACQRPKFLGLLPAILLNTVASGRFLQFAQHYVQGRERDRAHSALRHSIPPTSSVSRRQGWSLRQSCKPHLISGRTTTLRSWDQQSIARGTGSRRTVSCASHHLTTSKKRLARTKSAN